MSGKAVLEEVWGILLVVGFDFVFFRMALPGLSVTITSKQHAGACVCCLAEDCRKEDARLFQHFFVYFLGGLQRGSSANHFWKVVMLSMGVCGNTETS